MYGWHKLSNSSSPWARWQQLCWALEPPGPPLSQLPCLTASDFSLKKCNVVFQPRAGLSCLDETSCLHREMHKVICRGWNCAWHCLWVVMFFFVWEFCKHSSWVFQIYLTAAIKNICSNNVFWNCICNKWKISISSPCLLMSRNGPVVVSGIENVLLLSLWDKMKNP